MVTAEGVRSLERVVGLLMTAAERSRLATWDLEGAGRVPARHGGERGAVVRHRTVGAGRGSRPGGGRTGRRPGGVGGG